FKNTITPLPLTDGSHASILTSLHPLVHGVRNNATRLTDNAETIAETLQKNGYHTIGAVSVYHLGSRYNYSQGFDSFSDQWDKNKKHNLEWQRIAKYTNQSLFQQIDDYKKNHSHKPLFIWVHYYDPHVPYINWEHIQFKPQTRMKYKGTERYDKDIRYTDDAIKTLHNYLEQKELTKKLVTCITSDHGEQLGEHGIFADHFDFYSETSFVPLILHGYRIPKNKVVTDFISTMDVSPTLLGLANLSFDSKVHGINLLDSDQNPKLPPPSKRDFVLIGYPRIIRSVQWIRQPFSYILNNDHFYKYWYVTQNSNNHFPEEKLKPVTQREISLRYLKKSDQDRVLIDYPYKIRKGFHYGVLQLEIKKNHGISIEYNVGSRITNRYDIDGKSNNKRKQTVTAYFPITVRDRLTVMIFKKKETEIENLRYAILPAKELDGYLIPQMRLDSKIFETLRTLRKHKRRNELYNLEKDPKMLKNILKGTGRTILPKEIEGRKKIYRHLNRYLKESKKISQDGKRKKPLTDKEKEMLKSLGYL
ncbi:MAG: sulfatase, partial [bacterium]|nr:sulfatase [bacterium]